MAGRSYQEYRDTKSKVTRVIGISLLAFVILLIGIGLFYAGLNAESCSGGFLGFGQTCTPRIDYSLLVVGGIFIAFSALIFLLAWKTYKRPEMTTVITEIQQPMMVRCSYCKSNFPMGTSKCSRCGAAL